MGVCFLPHILQDAFVCSDRMVWRWGLRVWCVTPPRRHQRRAEHVPSSLSSDVVADDLLGMQCLVPILKGWLMGLFFYCFFPYLLWLVREQKAIVYVGKYLETVHSCCFLDRVVGPQTALKYFQVQRWGVTNAGWFGSAGGPVLRR